MENSLVPVSSNEIYVTHAEYQDCFIKVWANLYLKKRVNMEQCLLDYTNFSMEFNKLDLCGHTIYIYVWKTNLELRVYRCRILRTDLEAKTHTIVLLDYGQNMVVPYSDVREITKDIDKSILSALSQRITVNTFLLSEYIGKPKSQKHLISALCNKYYKYRKDFEIGGMTFVTLFNTELAENGLADRINLTSMITIANSMSSSIVSHNACGVTNSVTVSNQALTSYSFLKSQNLDYVTPIDIQVTRVNIDKNVILLTVLILDNDTDAIHDILNSLDRHNLKLSPVLEVFTPCLIIFHSKLVRAIILEVKIDGLFVDLVDYGIRKSVPRTAVFEIPPKCNFIEMRSLNVVLDKPKDITINESMLVNNYFHMLPMKLDLNFGLYKVKLFKNDNDGLLDIFNDISNNEYCLKPRKSPELFSITEIQDEIENMENSLINDHTMSVSHSSNNQIEKTNVEPKEEENVNQKDTGTVNQIEKQLVDKHITPILFLKKVSLMDIQEIIASLIYYESPFNFRVRQYNPDFEPYMDQIKSTLNSRHILNQSEVCKNMYVIYKNNQLDHIKRAQIIDMDPAVEKIQLQLVDEGDEIINECFDKITLYNFIESDCYLPGQLVLYCKLSDMWFPVMNFDTASMLQPYFNKRVLYKILIIKTDETGIKLVQMVQKDTNIDIADTLLKSGIGQRLHAAMKTDELPYEENLLKGQSFLSYIYHYHFKLCIQPEPNTVDDLEEEIQEYINNNLIPESLDNSNLQHTYCLATIDNNQWYRAYIKNINEESVIVNMFDIGLLTDVPFKQIRPITSDLMKKPQLCLNCNLEVKELTINIVEKTLYNVTVESIDTSGMLYITVKEHNTVPLANPIVRSIENISFVHVDGDLTYLQRSQDKLKTKKMSETLSKLNGKLENKSSIVPGDMVVFESHGMYYRSVVTSIDSEMAVVQCIDFGYEKQVEKRKLQYLGQTKIALLPAFVTVVKTFPMSLNVSKEEFLASMHVEDDGTLNAVTSIMASIQTQHVLMETLQKGCLVKVTCVYSSNDCWIVPQLFFDTLESISEKLVRMQSKIIPAVTEIGSLCAAQSPETKKWYRALILDEDKNTKNVLLIDSGEQMKALNTIKLNGEIQKIPNCALRCQVISNVDIKNLLNKNVKCVLISCNQLLPEVKLFLEYTFDEISSTQSDTEWTVVVSKFESFNKFYVKRIDNKKGVASVKSNNLSTYESKDSIKPPPIGSIVETQTDREDGIWYEAEVMAPIDDTCLIVRILSDGSICKSTKLKYFPDNSEKLYYECCLDEDFEGDEQISDPSNFDYISGFMMSNEWTMKTSSDTEPYKVTLTINDQRCIDILYELWPTTSPEDIENSSVSEPEGMDSKLAKQNGVENNVVVPDIESVTIKYADSFKCFYAESHSLSTLYMERIMTELDMCIVELKMVPDMVGSIVITYSESLKSWCRARVHEIISDGTASCYLLDDGRYDLCKQFYKPTDFLCVCPPIVRRCALYAPKLADKEHEIWFHDVDDMFKDILSIKDIKFDMIIKEVKEYQKLWFVTLKIDNDDVSEMLFPLNAQVTYVNSFTDFKIKTLSSGQKSVTELLQSRNVPKLVVENPKVKNLYLAEQDNKFKRVRFDALGGSGYVVNDVDDTMDAISVKRLYEVPESISNVPPMAMACSLILKDSQEIYSFSMFQRMVAEKINFIMCIITESDGSKPYLIKLYHDDQDILDILKLKK